MCLAVICVVALLPLLAVHSNAEEPNPDDPDIGLTPPVSPLEFDYYSDVDYQTWNVSTAAGTFSTPRRPGVYAYLTSVNAPKASTRTATEDNVYGLKSTVFVFKDVSAVGSLQYKPIYITQNINTLASLGSNQAPALVDSWFEFSNDCTLSIEFSWYDTQYAAEEPARYYEAQISHSYRFVNASSHTGFSARELINEFAEHIENEGFEASQAFITHMSIKIDTSEFSCDYPDNSYCHIYVPLGDIDRTVEYMTDNGGFLRNDTELYEYTYDLGERAGKAIGYQEGYDIGHAQGINVGVASNFEPGWFVRGVDAFLNVRLFQFAVGDNLVDFTLGTILSITLGGTALIWFLKLFAGG